MVVVEVAIGVHAPSQPAPSAPVGETEPFSSIVNLLMSVGHADGVLDPRARKFVRQYVDSVVVMREQAAMESREVVAKQSAAWRAHFQKMENQLDTELEAVRPDGLKMRVLEVFRGLSWSDQATALELVHGLLNLSGGVTEAEHALYDALMGAF